LEGPPEVGLGAARLADHDRVGLDLGGHVPRAVRGAGLLVGDQQQREPPARGPRPRGRDDHRRHRALHVGRAEAVQAVAFARRPERVDAPRRAADRLGVEVAAQHQVPAARPEVERREQVRPLRRPREHARRDRQRLARHPRHRPLVTRRVRARRPDQRGRQLDDAGHL
jgi:hypothetical protein